MTSPIGPYPEFRCPNCGVLFCGCEDVELDPSDMDALLLLHDILGTIDVALVRDGLEDEYSGGW